MTVDVIREVSLTIQTVYAITISLLETIFVGFVPFFNSECVPSAFGKNVFLCFFIA